MRTGRCTLLCCLARWRRTVTSSAALWPERIRGGGHQRRGLLTFPRPRSPLSLVRIWSWGGSGLATGPDGKDLAPMRMAEARVALGVISARAGDLEHLLPSRKGFPFRSGREEPLVSPAARLAFCSATS